MSYNTPEGWPETFWFVITRQNYSFLKRPMPEIAISWHFLSPSLGKSCLFTETLKDLLEWAKRICRLTATMLWKDNLDKHIWCYSVVEAKHRFFRLWTCPPELWRRFPTHGSFLESNHLALRIWYVRLSGFPKSRALVFGVEKHRKMHPLIFSPEFGFGLVQIRLDGLVFGGFRGFSVRLIAAWRATPRCPLHPPASSFVSCVAAFLPVFSCVRLPSVVSFFHILIDGLP